MQKINDPDECPDEKWTITLENGTEVYGEDWVWPHRLGDTQLKANVRILQFSTSGSPDIIQDMTEDNTTEHQQSDAGTPPGGKSKGGCAVSPIPHPGSLEWIAGLGILATLATRRRKQA